MAECQCGYCFGFRRRHPELFECTADEAPVRDLQNPSNGNAKVDEVYFGMVSLKVAWWPGSTCSAPDTLPQVADRLAKFLNDDETGLAFTTARYLANSSSRRKVEIMVGPRVPLARDEDVR
jgi:hypothetical protein